MAADPTLARVGTRLVVPVWLGAAPLVAFCATCWGQGRIYEPGPLGLVPVCCPDCRAR